jgi:hypothetical protein
MGYNFGKDSDSSKIPRTALNVPARPGSIDPKVQQVDVFPLDAFLFDDPNRTANPRVMLKSPWVWEVQSEIDALETQVGELQKSLSISIVTITRNRANVTYPGVLTLNAADTAGVAYYGRFKVYLRYGTGSVITVYTSPIDETTYAYPVPATVDVSGTIYAVIGVLCELYATGGTVAKLDTEECAVGLEANASAVYWGALTANPTSGFIAGDFYWDNRTVGTGTAGTPLLYDGTAWVEYLSSMAGYQNAMVTMLADMGAWATAQGSVVAAASAIFQKLVTADAFIANLFTQQITVGSGGRIRYETGSGVQKRTVQLADEKIDWIDTPDTTPASPELLRARIGRLGVGGAVLMDGDFQANCEHGVSEESVINSASSAYPVMIQQSDGLLRLVYQRVSDKYLLQRTSIDGVTWSAETTINAAESVYPAIIQQVDGLLRLTYRRFADGYLVQRTSDDGTTWSSESTVNAASSYEPAMIQQTDGSLRVVYRRGSDSYLVQRTSLDGVVWSSESIINSSVSLDPTIIQQFNGLLMVAYQSGSPGPIVQRTSDDGTTWSTESNIDAAISSYPMIMQQSDGVLRVVYFNGSIVQRTSPDGGVTWSAASIINGMLSYDPSTIQQADGSLRVVYRRVADNYIVQRTLQRYARIGAGIIESGSNANGSYIKYGDGTMMQWGTIASATTLTYTTFGYPATFVSSLGVTKCAAISGSLIPSVNTGTVIFWNSDYNQGTYYHTGPAGNILYWQAIGRWKA